MFLQCAEFFLRSGSMEKNKIRILSECAMLVALAVVMGYIPVFTMLVGGSVTIGAMAPLVIASLRHGAKWGVMSGFAYGTIRALVRGMRNIMIPNSIAGMVGVALLDYIVAYAVIGIVCVFAWKLSNRLAGAIVAAIAAGVLRYICHTLSGVIIWTAIWPPPEGASRLVESAVYNSTYMIPETIVTVIVTGVVVKVFGKRLFA
jgi:thiamine transporter